MTFRFPSRLSGIDLQKAAFWYLLIYRDYGKKRFEAVLHNEIVSICMNQWQARMQQNEDLRFCIS